MQCINMKRSFKVLLTIALVSTFTACEKGELQLYDQPDMVYIYKDASNVTSQDSAVYSFALKAPSLMTDTVKIPLRIMGVAKPADRVVGVKAVADSSTAVAGEHYDFLVSEIKANEYTGYINVLVKRTPEMKTREFRLVIEVTASKDFEPGIANTTTLPATQSLRGGGSTRYLIKINDYLVKPGNWDTQLTTYFGSYSQVKYKFVIDVTGRNTFVLSSAPDAVSISQLLYFKVLCKDALAAYESANGPMIDEFGNRVSFP